MSEQLTLLEAEETDRYEQPENPVHNARYLRERNPEKFKILLDAIQGGGAVTTLARVYKVSVNTIYAIIESELGGVDKWHAGLLGKLQKVANLGTERMIELLPECKDVQKAAIVTGIAIEKAALLAGLPTTIHEVRHTVDDAALTEFNNRLLTLRQANATVVEEVPAPEPVAA